MPINFFDKKTDKNKQKKKTERDEEIMISREFFYKFEVAKQAKSEYVSTWDECIDAYNSDYFTDTSKPDYKSDEVSNYIFSTIETIKPIMVDNNPQIQALPKKPDAMISAKIIDNAMDSEWHRDDMPTKLTQIATLCLIMGTAIIMTKWNGDKNNGLGDTENIIVNPYNFFPDPMAHDLDSSEYCMYAAYKHVNLVKKMFPKRADMIEGGTINYSELVDKNKDTSNVTNQVLILDIYTKDYATIEYEEVDEDGNKVKKQKKKYPNGRHLVIAPELDLVLLDQEAPYNDGEPPYVIFKGYDVPFQFWGKGEIENLLSPQTHINELTNQIIDNAKNTANNAWVIDKNAGIGKGQLTNRPGLIIRKNPGTEVKRIAPPPLPNYVFETTASLKRDIEIISGIHDVTQGRKPGSISAGVAIMALQEAAQARIRLKVKSMEQSLAKLGKKWFSRMQQFWITDRYIRYINDQEEIQFIQVAPEDLQVDIDFRILAGSTMPQNKGSMLDFMIRMAQTGAEDGLPVVDREAILDYADIPNKRKIITRLKELAGLNKQEAEVQNQQQVQMQNDQASMRHQMEMEQMQAQGQIDAEVAQPTDAQLDQIIQIIAQNPQLLDIIISQVGTQRGY